MPNSTNKINPTNGYCPETKTFHSLRPPLLLPPSTAPISAASFALSLRYASPYPFSAPALINSATSHRLSYSDFVRKTSTLASSLRTQAGLSKGDTAFILSPNSTLVPILCFSLLSIGVVVSPANPTSTESEVSRLVGLSKPSIAFATSSTRHKLPRLRRATVLLDSAEFESMLNLNSSASTAQELSQAKVSQAKFESMPNSSASIAQKLSRVEVSQAEFGSMLNSSASTAQKFDQAEVSQTDTAAIMYSSGTTGTVKGVVLTHRNLTAIVAGYHAQGLERAGPAVVLYTVPYFHVFGFFHSLKSVAMGEAVVVMQGRRFDLRRMVGVVEEFGVTHVAVAPPVVVAMAKGGRELRTLEGVLCGGASLGKDVIAAFKAKYPRVVVSQGYGLTESTGTVARMMSPEESMRWGSVGRIQANCEAKIVDPDTGTALPPCNQGELWIRGPTIMKGYIGDSEATSTTLLPDGWLRTGDLCYFDDEGFLFVVDRLKELIKYKGYQVPPAELEQLLQSHPEIDDAAVIPYPDEEAGQLPMAVVVRRHQSNLNGTQVMEFVAKQVAPYKKIRRVAFVSSIPKSAAGKILRKELRKIFVPRPLSRL